MSLEFYEDIEVIDGIEIPPSKNKECYWYFCSNKLGFHSTDKTGKWMIFLHISELDKSWEIIKKALFDGLLGPAAKCSTAKENPRQQDMQSAVIVCYTKDWSDEKDLERVSNSIRKLGFNQRLFYKKDSATFNKIYGAKSWYVDRAANT